MPTLPREHRYTRDRILAHTQWYYSIGPTHIEQLIHCLRFQGMNGAGSLQMVESSCPTYVRFPRRTSTKLQKKKGDQVRVYLHYEGHPWTCLKFRVVLLVDAKWQDSVKLCAWNCSCEIVNIDVVYRWGGTQLIVMRHHHYVPSVVNRSAVMDLHRSRSCATLLNTDAYNSQKFIGQILI